MGDMKVIREFEKRRKVPPGVQCTVKALRLLRDRPDRAAHELDKIAAEMADTSPVVHVECIDFASRRILVRIRDTGEIVDSRPCQEKLLYKHAQGEFL